MRKITLARLALLSTVFAFAAAGVSASATPPASPVFHEPMVRFPGPPVRFPGPPVRFPGPPVRPRPTIVPAAAAPSLPLPLPRPTSTGFALDSRYVSSMPRGARVPLSQLPPLPPKPPKGYGRASILPSLHGRLRPFAATGATVMVNGQFGNNCLLTYGAIFNNGCVPFWQSQGLPAGNFEDYYVAANSTVATAVQAYSLGGGGGSGPGEGSGGGGVPTLNQDGVWIFGVYDTTAKEWVAVTYVNVTNNATITTYSDSGLTAQTNQFLASNGNSAYIDVKGLTATDRYFIFIEQTSLHPACVFTSPGTSPPVVNPPNPLCRLGGGDVGQGAPGGELTVYWPFSGSESSGTYSISVYDQTTAQRMGQTQVALVAGGETTSSWTLKGDGSAANPSPRPLPLATPATVFAWDGASDQSDSGFAGSVSGLNNSSWLATVSDPQGLAVSTQAYVGAGVFNQVFNFNSFNGFGTPDNYLPNVYTLSLYDQTAKVVHSTQAFRIVGYNALTQFNVAGTLGPSVSVPAGSNTPSVTLRFTNYGDNFYGPGNGDAIRGIAFTTGNDFTNAQNGSGIQMYPNGGAPGTCTQAAPCSLTASDSINHIWNVSIVCSPTGGSDSQQCYLTAVPNSVGQWLPPGAYLEIPNLTFSNDSAGTGTGNCSSCTGLTSILPQDGLAWSQTGQLVSSNPVNFNDNSGGSDSATVSVTLYGHTQNGGGSRIAKQDVHAYETRPNQNGSATYAATILKRSSPFMVSSLNAFNVYDFHISVAAGSADGIRNIEILPPGSLAANGSLLYYYVDTGINNNWRTTNCPAGANTEILCFFRRAGTLNPNRSDDLYVGISAPLTSFTYSDWSVASFAPTNFTLVSAGARTVYAGASGPQTVDALSLAAYSLDANLITPTVSQAGPPAGGYPMNVTVQNALSGSDPNPDSLDAVVVQLRSAISLGGAPLVSTPNWKYLGSVTSGANINYWFTPTACNVGEVTAGNLPASNPPPPTSPTLPVCTSQASEQSQSLEPGQDLQFKATFQNVNPSEPFTFYEHGANSDAWTIGRVVNVSTNTYTANVGFSKTGRHGAAQIVPTNSEPLSGSNSDPTFGNDFVYTLTNTGAPTKNITSFTITIPGKDTGGVNAYDGTQTFDVTATSALTGSGAAGCTVSSITQPTNAGADGSIVVTGCNIASNAVVNVPFSMKVPNDVNRNFQFGASITPAGQATETWTDDTIVKIVLSGNIVVSIDPGNPGPGGSTPLVNCPTCTFDTGQNTIDLGSVGQGVTANFTDVARVSVYTNAQWPVTWKVYVSTDNNPANTVAPTNEFLTSIDNVRSSKPAGLNFDAPVYAVVPQSAPGLLLVDTGAGTLASNNPYDLLMNYEIAIKGGPVLSEISTVTYTFVGN